MAGLCPGKRESGKPSGGDTWLKGVLGEVAWGISRLREHNYLSEQYHRIARRRGKKKAVVAVAHSVLVIAYHLLQTRQPFASWEPTTLTSWTRSASSATTSTGLRASVTMWNSSQRPHSRDFRRK